jgi:hypothetical protein
MEVGKVRTNAGKVQVVLSHGVAARLRADLGKYY